MKVTIAYHPTYDTAKDIIEVDAFHIITRGTVAIDSIIGGGNNLTIYLKELPTRIDQHDTTVTIMDTDFAKRHPKPFVLYSDTEYFGKPKTIWQNKDNHGKRI